VDFRSDYGLGSRAMSTKTASDDSQVGPNWANVDGGEVVSNRSDLSSSALPDQQRSPSP
jgi:hypothetical protein